MNSNDLSTVTQTPRSHIVFRPALVSVFRQNFVKAGRLVYTIIRLRRTLSRKALILCYYSRPVVEYACIAWPKLSANLRYRLERFQRRSFKGILRKPMFEPSDHDGVLLTLQQRPLESRRQYQSAKLGLQLANKTAPQHLLNECFPPASPVRSLLQRNHFQLPTPHTTFYQSSPFYFAARRFNELPKHLQSIKDCPSSREEHNNTFCHTPVLLETILIVLPNFSHLAFSSPTTPGTSTRTHTHTHTLTHLA